MKKTHYAGEKIGMLTLIEKIKTTLPNGRIVNKWRCVCDCGNETFVFASNLGKTLSCGHLIKEAVSKSKFQDLSGQRFSMLTVIRRAPDRIRNNGKHVVQFECRCDCGNTKCIDAAELRKGVVKSCGCNSIIFMKHKNTKDLTGKTFGKLTVIKQLQSVKYGKNNSTMTKWLCQCECGSTIEVFGNALRRGQLSCGCVNSKGEEAVSKCLSEMGIHFSRQYFFPDLTSEFGRPLFFDFAVWKDGELSLLEYQGIQHFVPQPNYFGDYQRNITDVLKKEYCMEHKITLYEIRYDDDVNQRIYELYGNPVPSTQNA